MKGSVVATTVTTTDADVEWGDSVLSGGVSPPAMDGACSGKRELRMVFSPCAPCAMCTYVITVRGLEGVAT